jgi:hypothetical protein
MADNESTKQMELANSPVFLTRLQYSMMQAARTVLDEAWETPGHAMRANYARRVIDNPVGEAHDAAPLVVGGPNLINTVIGGGATADSSATDAAIFAQVSSYWNPLSGWESQTPAPPAPTAARHGVDR